MNTGKFVFNKKVGIILFQIITRYNLSNLIYKRVVKHFLINLPFCKTYRLVDPHLHQKDSQQNRHKERDHLCNDSDLVDLVWGKQTFPYRLQLVDIL